MRKLAIIPARGGSKRLPGKNIRLFLGKPVIAYSIQVAKESGLFDEIMVSTEDRQIGEVAKEYGAALPFWRSAETADDHATTSDVLQEVLESYRQLGMKFDLVCCIYPCAPLVTAARLGEAVEQCLTQDLDSVFPVVKYGHPIQRAFILKDGLVKMCYPEHMFTRTQDLDPAYHDAGQFYWLNAEAFARQKSLVMSRSGAIVLSEMEAQDIDNITDWKLAEIKYQLLHSQTAN